jgi:arylformamidase
MSSPKSFGSKGAGLLGRALMIFDITPPIRASLAVWPGDTRPTREVLMDLARGDSITLSTLHATVHLGAHADAPSHYGLRAQTIESRDLSLYLGICQVVGMAAGQGGLVTRDHLIAELTTSRLLIRTGTFPDPDRFNEDFAALSPDFVDYCAARGVRLIGIDTPSVDPFTSKTLDAHRTFLRHDMAILEGLTLETVPDGLYELIALPLRLVGFDASPVRAILRTLDDPGRAG